MTTATFRKTWPSIAKTMDREQFILEYVIAFTARKEDRECVDGYQLRPCKDREGYEWGFASLPVMCDWSSTVWGTVDNIRRSPLCRLYRRAIEDWMYANTATQAA